MARLTGKSIGGVRRGKRRCSRSPLCLSRRLRPRRRPPGSTPRALGARQRRGQRQRGHGRGRQRDRRLGARTRIRRDARHPDGDPHPGRGLLGPTDLSLSATDPVVAVAPDGEAVIAWRHFAGKYAIQIVDPAPRRQLLGAGTVAETPSNTLPAGIASRSTKRARSRRLEPARPRTPSSLPVPFFVMASVRPPAARSRRRNGSLRPNRNMPEAPSGRTRRKSSAVRSRNRRMVAQRLSASGTWRSTRPEKPSSSGPTSTAPNPHPGLEPPAAAGNFSQPQPRSPQPARPTGAPDVGFDAAGDAVRGLAAAASGTTGS